MAEIEILDLPNGFIDELNISDIQKKILNEQINRFDKLKTQIIDNKGISINEDGKVVLKEGTLIHGTSYFEPEKITNISKTGILTGQSLGIEEDGETFYCADFHRVSKTTTIEEYNKSFNYRDGRTPFGHFRNSSIAFIISPDSKLDELLSYDCYRENTNASDITKSFVNEMGLPNVDKEKLSSILYGVPSNAFSGIVIGDEIFKSEETVSFLIQLFPNCYITSKTGELVYEPTKFNEKEKIDLARQKYLLSVEKEMLTENLKNKEIELQREKNKYDALMDAMLDVCTIEQVAAVLLKNGWQGSLESTMKYVERLKEERTNQIELQTQK